MQNKIGLILTLLLFSLGSVNAQSLNLSAKSAIVIEAATKTIIYEQQSSDRRPPASTTKIMTLITALEHGALTDLVTVSNGAATTEGSSLLLEVGEQQTLADLLYGLMLVSGNDASVAIAEHISGSVEKFAQLMTQKAKLVGAVNTSFVNTSGLPADGHYSTAYDLALITAYGYKNPLFKKIINTPNYIISGYESRRAERTIYNENKLLHQYKGANGVKTGYTIAAGGCLVSGAIRNGVQLIAVVLNSDYIWQDSIALLDYGFKQTSSHLYLKQGQTLQTVTVIEGELPEIRTIVEHDVVLPSFNHKPDYKTVLELPPTITAPIKKGQIIGQAKIMLADNVITTVNLLAADESAKRSLWQLLWTTAKTFIRSVLGL